MFNHKLTMDLMWLKGNPVLHAVGTHTHFSAAVFIMGKRAKDIWKTFLTCWVKVYMGYPDKIRKEQEKNFASRELREISSDAGIQIQLSGIHSHNALRVGERYHSPLRRNCLKSKEYMPELDPKLALQLAVKVMNETMGPEGIVPSLLVFGAFSRFAPHTTTLLSHEYRKRAVSSARLEMSDIIAAQKHKWF